MTVAATAEQLEREIQGDKPDLVIVDLTTPDWDYARLFRTLCERATGTPVLGFTTHALASRTQPLHAACTRVVTKETLTRELPAILAEGVTP